MITCYIRYEIDPNKLDAFEAYAKTWISLVERFGGAHHGYFLTHEGASDIAIALFSFDSLADYETYRIASFRDADCVAAFQFAADQSCIRRYDRQFLRPVFEGDVDAIKSFCVGLPG